MSCFMSMFHESLCPFLYEKSSDFPLYLSDKAILYHKHFYSHLIPSVQNPNYQINRKVSANLQRCRFVSWVKVSQLQKNTD